MNPLVIGAIVLVIIGIALYFALSGGTTSKPATTVVPPLAAGGCHSDSDCTHPMVCNTTNGLCFDPNLADIIAAARIAVTDLYNTVQFFLSRYNNGNWPSQYATDFINKAKAMGLTAQS